MSALVKFTIWKEAEKKRGLETLDVAVGTEMKGPSTEMSVKC